MRSPRHTALPLFSGAHHPVATGGVRGAGGAGGDLCRGPGRDRTRRRWRRVGGHGGGHPGTLVAALPRPLAGLRVGNGYSGIGEHSGS
ncbi:hypothetical protein ACH474_15805 [Nocardia rhamnosiphila]|uniref:hypothetical protein n=1 Tax=Nocardia rhamnosiphila TaxID=426716 RepID=UPI003404A504